jgi:hypothetical protein
VWSGSRTAAIQKELETLTIRADGVRRALDERTPELRQILHAIAPTATPLFSGGGRCRRLFARRALKAALQIPAPRPAASAV